MTNPQVLALKSKATKKKKRIEMKPEVCTLRNYLENTMAVSQRLFHSRLVRKRECEKDGPYLFISLDPVSTQSASLLIETIWAIM